MIGWSHTRFGKPADETLETLIVAAARDAVADAGLSFAEIDEVFVDNFNSGMGPQGFPSSLALQGTVKLLDCGREEARARRAGQRR